MSYDRSSWKVQAYNLLCVALTEFLCRELSAKINEGVDYWTHDITRLLSTFEKFNDRNLTEMAFDDQLCALSEVIDELSEMRGLGERVKAKMKVYYPDKAESISVVTLDVRQSLNAMLSDIFPDIFGII